MGIFRFPPRQLHTPEPSYTISRANSTSLLLSSPLASLVCLSRPSVQCPRILALSSSPRGPGHLDNTGRICVCGVCARHLGMAGQASPPLPTLLLSLAACIANFHPHRIESPGDLILARWPVWGFLLRRPCSFASPISTRCRGTVSKNSPLMQASTPPAVPPLGPRASRCIAYNDRGSCLPFRLPHSPSPPLQTWVPCECPRSPPAFPGTRAAPLECTCAPAHGSLLQTQRHMSRACRSLRAA